MKSLAKYDGFRPFLFALAVACAVSAILLFVSNDATQYAIPADLFVTQYHPDNQTVRLEGTVHNVKTTPDAQIIRLCSGPACIRAHIPLQITTDFHESDEVILTGKWHDNTLWVIKVLKRCHPKS